MRGCCRADAACPAHGRKKRLALADWSSCRPPGQASESGCLVKTDQLNLQATRFANASRAMEALADGAGAHALQRGQVAGRTLKITPDANKKRPPRKGRPLIFLERETRFELATSTLARLHSTAELFPLVLERPWQ